MSQENVELVIKQFEDANARDFAAVMSAFAEDATVSFHVDAGPLSRTETGKAAVGDWFGDWFRQFGPDYRLDIEEARGSGDRVFVVATNHGRGKSSGAPVEQRVAYVYTVVEGKVSRMQVWSDREAALEAAGLSE